jgi:hypothetical protein
MNDDNKAERHRHGEAWTGDKDGELLDGWELAQVCGVVGAIIVIVGLVVWKAIRG